MFMRQHYKAIAEIIKIEKAHHSVFTGHHPAQMACNEIASKLSDYFSEDNSRFDQQKFLEACGIK